MTNPSDIARAMDAVQGLMADRASARPMLTNHQRFVLALAAASLDRTGLPTLAAALANAFGVTAGDLERDHEGETYDQP